MPDDKVQPYGVELSDDDIDELRETGDLAFRYDTPAGEDDVRIVLKYSPDGGGGSTPHRVTDTLR